MRIRTLFTLGMSGICVIAGAMVASQAYRDWASYQQTRAGQEIVADYAGGMKIVEAIVDERSSIVRLLSSPPPYPDDKLKALTDSRTKTDKAIDAFRHEIAQDHSQYRSKVLERLTLLTKKIADVRGTVDTDQQIADATARKTAVGQTVAAAFGITPLFTPTLNAIQRQIAVVDPSFLTLSNIARNASDLRNSAGLMMGRMTGPVMGHRPLTVPEALALERVSGATDTLANLLVTEIATVPRAAKLTAAADAMSKNFLGDAMEMFKGQVAIGEKDGHYTMEYAQLSPAFVGSEKTIYDVRDAALAVAAERAAEQAGAARNELVLALGLLAVILGVTGGITIYFRRRLIMPLVELTHTIVQIAGGARNIVVPHAGRRDEIGEIAGSLDNLLDTARTADQLAREREAEALVKQARGERLDQLTKEFEANIYRLTHSLADAATGMTDTATGMSATAGQTVQQSAAVSVASEQTSQNVQTVATATEELSVSIREIGQRVDQSAQVASRAVEDARQTDVIIRTLSERAQSIGQVINLISGIASQTNLLALNATIEAARAGEAGKGFAVVASEVKNLAGQTNKATEEITSQIGEIQKATSGAVEAIEHIAHTIGEINEISAAIAAAIEEQGAATSEIARNVSEAARTTQEVSDNIGGVREAADQTGNAASSVLSAASLLSDQAANLSQQVDSFVSAVKQA